MVALDIDMPKNCTECPCIRWGEYDAIEKSYCAAKSRICVSDKHKPNKCPLIKMENVEKNK